MNITVRQNLHNVLRYLLILIAFVVLLLAIGYRIHSNIEYSASTVSSFANDWYYYENGERVDVELPAEITTDQKELILYNDGLEKFPAERVILTKAAAYEPVIMQESVVKYRYMDAGFPRNKQMKSDLYCRAYLSTGVNAKQLAIVYNLEQAGMDGTYEIPEILIGSLRSVMLYECHDSLVDILTIIAIFLAASAALFFGIYFYIMGNAEKRFFYLAAFLLITDIWAVSDSGIVVSMVSPLASAFISLCAFYAFMLVTLPLIAFVKASLPKNSKKNIAADLLCIAVIINAGVQGIAFLMMNIKFIDMINFTQCVIMNCNFLLALLLGMEYFKKKTTLLLMELIGVMIITVCNLLSFLAFWKLSMFYHSGVYLGAILFAFLMMHALVDTSNKLVTEKMKERMSSHIMIDRMTGISGRNAYLQDMEFMKADPEHNTISAYLQIRALLKNVKESSNDKEKEMNNRKMIASASCIKKVFGHLGMCYRVSEFEFRVLVPAFGLRAEDLTEHLLETIEHYNGQADETDRIELELEII